MSRTSTRLRELLKQTTFGPWYLDPDYQIRSASHNVQYHGHAKIPFCDTDKKLIVAMHTALPLLLDVAEAAKRALPHVMADNDGDKPAMLTTRNELEQALSALEKDTTI